MKANAVSKICLAVALLMMFGAALHAGTYKYEETYTKTVDLEGAKRLLISNKRGDITIVGEDGRTDLELSVTEYVRAESEKLAREIAEKMTLEIKKKNGDCIIVAVFPDHEGDKKSILSVLLQRDPRSHMDIEVRAPRHLALKLQASSGDVDARGFSNDVHASTASGDIQLGEIGGDVEAAAASGDISIAEVGGNVRVESASGDLDVEEIGGSIVAKTASGDIDLRDLKGDLDMGTASGETIVKGVGNVDYKGSSGDASFYGVRGCVNAVSASGDLAFEVSPEGDHDYVLRTSSGQVVLRFTKALAGGFVLKASTTNGEIDVNLPINISKVGRHLITGVVRDGKSVVKMETVSGDITVVEEEEQ